ncbi:BfmA/BtgA family mobilization protein [Salegentibacter mishustinae]|uniref:BfmA/BtgA family mobilization protein n=2 Tax=Salegentibacter mishustinae TaxID=270918 RepID=UPI001986449A|nr:hypothetical protein GCM10008086_04980 [Salegentibacter mishustinae]|tara:strand:+ start:70 stop:270 length:201 start_codon:yes stop_codon:yes gene_type:complete
MNSISSTEMMGLKMETLENLIKKRINAVFAITRDMEKNKVNPTLAVLESLIFHSQIFKILALQSKN